MTVKTTRYMLVAIKAETTIGTDAFGGSDPGADDWIACYPDSFIQERRVRVPDTTVRAYAGANQHDSYGSHCDVEIHVPLTGKNGSAGSAPADPVDAALKAAGFEGAANAGVSYVYNLATFHAVANAPTCTVYLAEYTTDGNVRTYVATGVRWNMTLTASEASHVRLSFVGIGKYADTDEAPVSAPTNPSAYTSDKAPITTQGMTLALEAENFRAINFEVSTNWSLEEDRDSTGSTSLDEVDLIRGEDSPPIASVDFKDSGDLDYVLGEWKADSAQTLAAAFTDGTDTITVGGECQIQDYSKARGNIFSYSVPLGMFASSAGDDDLTLTFT